jgi:hypothetical protein
MSTRSLLHSCRRPRRAVFSVVALAAAIFCLPSHTLIGQELPSQDLISFIEAVNQGYVVPNGWEYRSLATQNPGTLAVLLGHALRQQLKFATTAEMRERTNTLVTQVRRQLDGYATDCGYRDVRGAPVSGEGLWSLVNAYMQGQTNEFFAQNPGVKVPQMAAVLQSRPAPSAGMAQPIPAGTAQPAQQTGQDSIDLVGVKAKPSSNPRPSNAPWLRASRTAPANNPLKEDCIVGLWEEMPAYNGIASFRFRVTQEGTEYVGRVDSVMNLPEFRKYFSFGVGTELFRVAIDTWSPTWEAPEYYTPEYKGQGLAVDTEQGGFKRDTVYLGISDARSEGLPINGKLYFKYHWFTGRNHFRRAGN